MPRNYARLTTNNTLNKLIMKSTKFFSAIMLFAALGFAACNQGPITPPDPEHGNPQPGDTTTTPVTGDIITVAQALEIIDGLAETAETTEEYQIQGTVKVLTKAADIESGKYNNLNYDLTDATGTLRCAFTNGLDNTPVTSVDQIPADGTELILKGKLKKYAKDGKITPEMVNGYIVKIVKEGGQGQNPPVEVVNDGSKEKPYTAAEVIALNNAQAGPFFVKAIIVGQIKSGGKSMTDAEFAAPFTGNDSNQGTNILIADAAGETNTANIVPVQLPSGMRDFSLPAAPTNLGKEIVVYGTFEAYFGQAGVKSLKYAKVDGKEYGTMPQDVTGAIFSETLLTQASYNKFTAVNVSGDQAWEFDEKYGAKMSGYGEDKKTHANEDWFISPAIDLTGKDVVLSFDHARGPAGSMSVAVAGHYTVWVTNNLNGTDAAAVAAATWTELQVPTHGTSAWGYVNSGEIAIPAANKAANFRFAFKYVCDDKESATWEIQNVVIK